MSLILTIHGQDYNDILPPFHINLLTSLWGRTKEEVQKYERETQKVERKTKEWVKILKSE